MHSFIFPVISILLTKLFYIIPEMINLFSDTKVVMYCNLNYKTYRIIIISESKERQE